MKEKSQNGHHITGEKENKNNKENNRILFQKNDCVIPRPR